MYTASTAFPEALTEAGVSHTFANFGSDHTALLEAIAAARETGSPIPRIVTCPNEMVGMSAAHGYAPVSGHPQAVSSMSNAAPSRWAGRCTMPPGGGC